MRMNPFATQRLQTPPRPPHSPCPLPLRRLRSSGAPAVKYSWTGQIFPEWSNILVTTAVIGCGSLAPLWLWAGRGAATKRWESPLNNDNYNFVAAPRPTKNCQNAGRNDNWARAPSSPAARAPPTGTQRQCLVHVETRKGCPSCRYGPSLGLPASSNLTPLSDSALLHVVAVSITSGSINYYCQLKLAAISGSGGSGLRQVAVTCGTDRLLLPR